MKPILFNTEMVQAILERRKTCTRRVIRPQPIDVFLQDDHDEIYAVVENEDRKYEEIFPPYQPGDILYVREAWNYGYIETADQPGKYDAWFEEVKRNPIGGPYLHLNAISSYFYKADEDAPGDDVHMIWRPSIHMPKEAARLFLRVVNVRAERLQEITNEQIRREGITPQRPKGMPGSGCKCNSYEEGCMEQICPNRDSYEMLCHYTPFMKVWDNTIKKADLPLYGWTADPWVWVIEFERITKEEANAAQ